MKSILAVFLVVDWPCGRVQYKGNQDAEGSSFFLRFALSDDDA